MLIGPGVFENVTSVALQDGAPPSHAGTVTYQKKYCESGDCPWKPTESFLQRTGGGKHREGIFWALQALRPETRVLTTLRV